jgi:hypothetical protein
VKLAEVCWLRFEAPLVWQHSIGGGNFAAARREAACGSAAALGDAVAAVGSAAVAAAIAM